MQRSLDTPGLAERRRSAADSIGMNATARRAACTVDHATLAASPLFRELRFIGNQECEADPETGEPALVIELRNCTCGQTVGLAHTLPTID